MSVVTAVQFFLSLTLVGLYFFDVQIGSSPFQLLRDGMAGAPIFEQPNYLEFIKDGNGLNPLLQNYWMVIHPPVLFLGFASTVFPFAYAVAALWTKDYKDWIKPAINWSLFSSMILITGIMMGAAWAYESLSFGGFWAWDPVENSSLVPWLVMVAGLHCAVIYKAAGYSLKSTLLFLSLGFLTVLYSTYLTRTGVLGDTSVHAFTGEGSHVHNHMLIFLASFFLLSIIPLIKNYRSIPDIKKEEELSSREFWMFIGALVLIISVVQITYTTSMPVWNKIFGTELTIIDPVGHYNKIQVWIGIVIALGTALVYYLKFKKTNWKTFAKKISIPAIIALVISGLIIYFEELHSVPVAILMFCSIFTVLANAFYIFNVKKGNLIKWGGNMSHIGFGLMLVGIILSSYNKEVISINRLGIDFNLGKETAAENKKESRENILLIKNRPEKMEDYTLTYTGDTVVGPDHFYRVKYERKDENGKILEEFVLSPNAQINPKMGLLANPDTKHYLHKDIFTYVTSTLDKSKVTDTTAWKKQKVRVGDSVILNNGIMAFNGFEMNAEGPQVKSGDLAVTTNLNVVSPDGKAIKANPLYILRGNSEIVVPDTLEEFGLYIKLAKILPDEKAALIEYKQPGVDDEYIIMKALLFPWINVLWLGTIIMIMGFLMSMFKRFTAK